MPKANINARQLAEKYQANCDRINEIADACEKEQRERNAAENSEFEALSRENQLLQMRMRALKSDVQPQVKAKSNDEIMRETLLKENKTLTVMLTREEPAAPTYGEPQTTAALAGTGIIPVHEQEMLKPMRLGLIWDKVGINIRTGLSGTLRWPKHSKAVAQFADEGEKLVDKSIEWGKLETTGHRLGIAIPVTKEELEDSAGVVEGVVREEMPAAIVDAINEALFTTVKGDRKVYGPFAGKTATEFASTEAPTRKELLKMKAAVAKKVKLVAPCWVMTEDMKAILEDVKVDAGSGRFLCENDTILGYPVFVTDAIEAGYIGFGDWSYQAAGFFGSMSLVADPYTLARKHSVDFVLNTRFGTVTLRDDAFALGKVKAQ